MAAAIRTVPGKRRLATGAARTSIILSRLVYSGWHVSNRVNTPLMEVAVARAGLVAGRVAAQISGARSASLALGGVGAGYLPTGEAIPID
ncbi:hypothetical protein [uncultured Roseobacter sp.]|uniref:hypothetical protein n=1 Tax=uncultured Roseobacter sp. TaxID=114847 RepID=UPI0026357A47|nr:hypothetical protein [uncultured Roseobacter sp.]